MNEIPVVSEASSFNELLLNIVATIFAVVIVGMIAFLIKKMVDHNRAIQAEATAAEELFARRELGSIKAPLPGVPPVPSSAPDGALPPLQPAAPAAPVSAAPEAPPVPVAPSVAPLPTGNLVEDAARRLQALGIVLHSEGRLPMPIPPDGLIYRMKNGGLCAILPRLEAEATMLHLARRFDLLVVVASDGELITCERFQNRVKDFISVQH